MVAPTGELGHSQGTSSLVIIIYRVTRTVPVYSVQLQWEQDERGCATQRSRGRRVCSPRSSTRWRLSADKQRSPTAAADHEGGS